MPARILTHTLIQLLVLAAQAGCLLLLHLSGFGQTPFDVLPPVVTVFLGLLVSGPLYSLVRGLTARAVGIHLAVSALLSAALAVVLQPSPDYTPVWLLAPVTAWAAVLLLQRSGRTGEMLSAMGVYVACTVLATFTLDSFLPVGGFFLVNVGTFFFGITFTQRDRVHRFGRGRVYAMILVAAVSNVLVSLALDTPMRYVIVSFLTIMIAETADTEVYQRLLHRPWLQRVAGSNAVSTPIDTILFTVLAFAGETWATFGWMVQVIVTDIIVKYAAGLLVALGLVRLVRWDPQRQAAQAAAGREAG